jgi:hypothetical protein
VAASNCAGVSGAASEGEFGFRGERVAQRQRQVAEDVQVRAAIEGAAVGGEGPVVVALGAAVVGERRGIGLGAAGDAVGAVEAVLAVPRIEGGGRFQRARRAEAAQRCVLDGGEEQGRVERAAEETGRVEPLGMLRDEARSAGRSHRHAGDGAEGVVAQGRAALRIAADQAGAAIRGRRAGIAQPRRAGGLAVGAGCRQQQREWADPHDRPD